VHPPRPPPWRPPEHRRRPSFPPRSARHGPGRFSPGVNPLTGLVVPIRSVAGRPVLVSITDSPLTARPQAGLSFSSFVYEFYLGEAPRAFCRVLCQSTHPDGGRKLESDSVKVGPIRSGRMLYESLRKLYNGFLVFAGATSTSCRNCKITRWCTAARRLISTTLHLVKEMKDLAPPARVNSSRPP